MNKMETLRVWRVWGRAVGLGWVKCSDLLDWKTAVKRSQEVKANMMQDTRKPDDFVKIVCEP